SNGHKKHKKTQKRNLELEKIHPGFYSLFSLLFCVFLCFLWPFLFWLLLLQSSASPLPKALSKLEKSSVHRGVSGGVVTRFPMALPASGPRSFSSRARTSHCDGSLPSIFSSGEASSFQLRQVNFASCASRATIGCSLR